MKLVFTDERTDKWSYSFPNRDFNAMKKELNRWLRSHDRGETPLYKIELDFTEDQD